MYFGDANTVVITDNNRQLWDSPHVDGEQKFHGLIPRDFVRHPVGSNPAIPGFDAVDFPLVPDAEVAQRLKDVTANGMLNSQQRRRGWKGKPIPSRDQNGRGYCWQHSGVSCMLILRAKNGQPYADLSAYGPACRDKNWRDEGGWGPEGIDNLIKWGCPTSKTWPQRGTSRSYDNDESRAEALLYRVDEGWIDLQAAEYDRNLTFAQIKTCALMGWPWTSDHNWWSHSVCGMDLVDGAHAYSMCRNMTSGKLVTLVEFERVWDMSDPATGGYGTRIWNSWGDSWSDMGEGILPPQKCVPDGSVALCTVTAAMASRRIVGDERLLAV